MKFLVVLAVAIACVSADDSQAPIVRSEFNSSPDGAFQYGYETGNGISHNAGGVIRDQNSENPILEVKGGFKYNAPDGTPIELSYIANEYGFQPVGNHLPVPPPIPEYITRALAYIAARTPQAEKAGGRFDGRGSQFDGRGSQFDGRGSQFDGRGSRGLAGRPVVEYETVTEIITKKIPVIRKPAY